MTADTDSARPKPLSRFPWRGLGRHLWLTLRLNFRTRQPLVYGYLVPVFFLLAFGSVFRGGTPPLLHEMGQLLTITLLGGACFGMPTATVAERERGVWRRYRLLPASAAGIALSTVVARFVLILSAAAMQIVLAWAVYRAPWPTYPVQLTGAFGCAAFAFLGLGLMITMLADNVPAVQALGQAVFLPMIMIGGVGVPLGTLPPWAQRVADFLPGRYAVEILDACIQPGGGGLMGAKLASGALLVIGAAAFAAAVGLFRWDAGPRPLGWRASGWIALALAGWVGMGLVSGDRRQTTRKPSVAAIPAANATPAATVLEPWRTLRASDVASITFDDLSPDADRILPLAHDYSEMVNNADKQRLEQFVDRLAYWTPGTAAVPNKAQRVRNLLSVCAVADLVIHPDEREIARAVFDQVSDAVPDPAERSQILAWIILHPSEGLVIANMGAFGIEFAPAEPMVRERVAGYAKKFLRELRG